MAVATRMNQDRRYTSRLPVRMECQFTDGSTTYRAVIINLSLDGAYLAAKHLPTKGSNTTVTLSAPGVKMPLILCGKVTRGGYGTSEIGIISKFGVKFSSAPIELMTLLKDLNHADRAHAGAKSKANRQPA